MHCGRCSDELSLTRLAAGRRRDKVYTAEWNQSVYYIKTHISSRWTTQSLESCRFFADFFSGKLNLLRIKLLMRIIFALIAAACAIAGYFASNGEGAHAWDTIGLSGFTTALPPELAAGATSLRNEHRVMFSDENPESPCWIDKLDQMSLQGCEDLADHEARARVALVYSACHLQKTGRNVGIACDGQSVAACIPRLSHAAQAVFDGFFRQIETVCVVAKASRFQRAMQLSVRDLFRAVHFSTENMMDFHKRFTDMGKVLSETQSRVEENLLQLMSDETSRHEIVVERSQQFLRSLDDAFTHTCTRFECSDTRTSSCEL